MNYALIESRKCDMKVAIIRLYRIKANNSNSKLKIFFSMTNNFWWVVTTDKSRWGIVILNSVSYDIYRH